MSSLNIGILRVIQTWKKQDVKIRDLKQHFKLDSNGYMWFSVPSTQKEIIGDIANAANESKTIRKAISLILNSEIKRDTLDKLEVLLCFAGENKWMLKATEVTTFLNGNVKKITMQCAVLKKDGFLDSFKDPITGVNVYHQSEQLKHIFETSMEVK